MWTKLVRQVVQAAMVVLIVAAYARAVWVLVEPMLPTATVLVVTAGIVGWLLRGRREHPPGSGLVRSVLWNEQTSLTAA